MDDQTFLNLGWAIFYSWYFVGGVLVWVEDQIALAHGVELDDE